MTFFDALKVLVNFPQNEIYATQQNAYSLLYFICMYPIVSVIDLFRMLIFENFYYQQIDISTFDFRNAYCVMFEEVIYLINYDFLTIVPNQCPHEMTIIMQVPKYHILMKIIDKRCYKFLQISGTKTAKNILVDIKSTLLCSHLNFSVVKPFRIKFLTGFTLVLRAPKSYKRPS